MRSTDAAGGELIAPGLVPMTSLGGGELFEVWSAFDERLHAPVVVKVLRPERDDAAGRAAVQHEADLLTRLHHPGLVRLFSADADADRPHLVLENIDGPTLSSLLSRFGPLEPHQLLPLGLELASALHYLHGEGVVHLDVKASNVVMGAPARLIDLSIAMDGKRAAELDHAIGSDEYMAPEQCEPGARGTAGPASDVWALGVTLFRAAAGFRPFDREPLWAQLSDQPHPLPERVPAPLAEIIGDCLAVDPDRRPLPVEVAERLEPMLGALPAARLSGFSLRR